MRLAVFALLLSGATFAQATFEAVSVKVVSAGANVPGRVRGGPGTNSPGQLSGAGTMRSLLMMAYGLKNYQISGPGWMESERYEVVAKIPAGASKADVAMMLQAMLADRFGLVAHLETKELPIFALVVTKGGPKFKQSGAVGSDTSGVAPKLVKGTDGFPALAPGSELSRSYQVVVGGSDGIMYKVWGRHETMPQLAERLSSQLNRAVVDATELKGQYDFALTWTMESFGGAIPRTDPPPDEIDSHTGPVMSDPGLSIFTAVQAQLGLKLESRKGPQQMLVVEKAERVPTGN
jgi:uncharacterized protein (TIGR03435 family)